MIGLQIEPMKLKQCVYLIGNNTGAINIKGSTDDHRIDLVLAFIIIICLFVCSIVDSSIYTRGKFCGITELNCI